MFFFTNNPNLKKKKLGWGVGGVGRLVGGGKARVSEFFFYGSKFKIKKKFFFWRGGGC